MILEQQKQAEVIQQGNIDETIKMSLDLDSVDFIMQMLSKNLYSDPIGSLIRESCSNALDSHRKAGVNEPILVNLEYANDNYEYSVEDKGIGLDHNDVVSIISKYGKSTKREDNTQIGGWGLGLKAPLAYSSNFFLVCRKNGVERKYMMYEGEDKNSIDLLYENETKERNGVKIIVPVSKYDHYDFKSKIREQLCYFENVYFNVKDVENDFIISRHDDFQYSSLCGNSYMHITLDDVYYPIDWKSLGIEEIDVPVALRFSLTDGIYPLPNRETLKYTKDTIEKIKNKINKVADYFVKLYNENIKICNNPLELYDFLRSSSRIVAINDQQFKINALIKHSTAKELEKPKLPGFSSISPESFLKPGANSNILLQEYEVINKIDNGVFKQCTKHYDRELEIDNLNRKIILVTEPLKGIKKEYFKENYNGRGYSKSTLIVKKVISRKLKDGTANSYYEILNLKSYPKSEWRNRIKEYQLLTKLIVDTWIDGDKIIVPQSFIDARKTVRTKPTYISSGRRVKLSGDVSVKKAERLQRWVNDKNCKWTSELWKIQNIEKHKNLIVWGTEKDVVIMDKLFEILDKYGMKTKITLLLIGERELKNIQSLNIHNLISFDKFMEGKNKPFKRLVTAYLINQLRIKNRNVFDSDKFNSLSYVSTELAVKLGKLDDYKDKHYNSASDTIWNAMLEIAKENNLWDETIYSDYIKVKNILEKLSFLNTLCKHLSYSLESNADLLTAIVDLCKYHKFKVNAEHYIAKPVEVLNEQLLEETV